MKLFVLFLSFIAVAAWAQVGEDPNMALYIDSSTMNSTVVDTTGTYASVTAKDGQKAVPFCPNCNLHGSINLVDENGSSASGSSSGSSTGGASEEGSSQGQ